MFEYLIKRWFLTVLVISIPLGLFSGHSVSLDSLNWISTNFASKASPCFVAFVLFLMSFTLDIQKLTAAMKAPAPVLWGCAISFIALPLLSIPLSQLQLIPDFAAGLLITAAVPSTMASASVWARKADGNDAVSLLTTILTNGFCFLITPFWLARSMGDTVTFDTFEMIQRLFYTAVLPILLGQVSRLHRSLKQLADTHKGFLGVIAQILLLSMVFWSAVKGGGQLQMSSTVEITFVSLLVIWVSCGVLHVLGILLAYHGGRALRFQRADIVAVIFSGSQKTLPIGIYIATDLLAERNLPFAAFPILIYHATQLIGDTLLIDPLKRWVKRGEPSRD